MIYRYEKEYYNALGLCVVGTVGALTQVGTAIINGYQPFMGSVIGMNVGIALPAIVSLPRKRKIYKIFNDVKNTHEFVEHKKLYDELIVDIAELLKSLGFKGDLSAAFFLKMCLDSGLFSETRDVQFATFDKDYFDRFPDVTGARVTTGAFCCRHVASLITDVINKMDGVACDISVYRDIGDGEDSTFANHLVTGLVHKDNAVLFESSIPMVLMSMGGAMEFKTNSGKIIAEDIDNNVTLFERNSDFDFEKINKKNRKILGSKECLSVVGNEDLYGDYMDSFLEYITHCGNLERFYKDELPKIKRLSMLNSKVTPHSNDK